MNWIVRTNDFKTSPLTGDIITPPKKQLTTAALKKMGLFWGLALLCLPIPGLHFILVPLFFVIGIGTFFKFYKKTAYLEKGGYTCPTCAKSHEVKNWFFQSEEKLRCGNCGTQLVVLQVLT